MYLKILKNLSARPGRIVVISDPKVAELYSEGFCEALRKKKPDTVLLKIPSGEGSKSREVKSGLEDQLINLRVARGDLLLAFGGGVVSDIVGYLAATYLRGISYMVIPTTLMGMVDAAIGGKNGINHPMGKNLMGSLYAPEDVFIEPEFLKTLSSDTYREGFIEVIKYGLIWDEEMFAKIEAGTISENEYIWRSIQIKRAVVKADPNDSSVRRVLNYGHLVAHAIEKFTSYTVSHGRALWFGLLVENYLSYLYGFISPESLSRMTNLLVREDIRFPAIQGLSSLALYEAMKNDKKASNSVPRVVLLKRIGKVQSFGGEFCTPLAYADFALAFSWAINLIEKPKAIRSLTA
jgi:3-dehydroquinate synthase